MLPFSQSLVHQKLNSLGLQGSAGVHCCLHAVGHHVYVCPLTALH